MSKADTPNQDAENGDATRARRRTRRRSRVLLNLGVPFKEVDRLLNQSEDVVGLGYDVLVGVVEEVRKGYADAQAFVEERKKGNSPDVPWTALVDRMLNIQEVFLGALGESVDIASDSARSMSRSVKDAVKTAQDARTDEKRQPALAGPVFEDIITIDVTAGEAPVAVTRTKRHPGLARLRIRPAVSELKEMLSSGGVSSAPDAATLSVATITFEPDPGQEQDSKLTVLLEKVPYDQKPGTYEGLITATNFKLFIARLRVRVQGTATTSAAASGRQAK